MLLADAEKGSGVGFEHRWRSRNYFRLPMFVLKIDLLPDNIFY